MKLEDIVQLWRDQGWDEYSRWLHPADRPHFDKFSHSFKTTAGPATERPLQYGKDGKARLRLAEHGADIVRLVQPGARPYTAGTDRDRAFAVVVEREGQSVSAITDALHRLNGQVQRNHRNHKRLGRPLGWLALFAGDGHIKLLSLELSG